MLSNTRTRSVSRCGLWLLNAQERTVTALQAHGLLATILVAGSVFIPGIATAQAPHPQAKPKVAVPVTMTECEGTNNCATWTFLGGTGNGNWPSGEIANLTVDSSDANNVVIRRADSTGASAGLTATYTGVRHEDHVGGEYTSSWPGHWDKKSGNWYATVEKSPEALPDKMRFCGPVHCGTLTGGSGHYNAVYDDGGNADGSAYTVEVFTREAVRIKRVDANGGKAVLTGKISPTGNSIVDGKLTWQGDNGTSSTYPYQLTWGTAFGSAKKATPQPPQPVFVPLVRPAVCVPWFFTIVCG